MRKTRRKLRGQAEIIGGVIVLTALVLSMGLILASIGRLSSTSMTGISRRTLFESEKSFEKADIMVSGHVCYVVNTGSVPLSLARIWIDNNPIDIPFDLRPLVTLQPGDRKDVSDLKSTLGVNKIDYIVTTRGNVFPVEPACLQQSQTNIIYILSGGGGGGGYFTSENILNTLRIQRGIEQRLIYANITTDKAGTQTYALIYYNSTQWSCVNMTTYQRIPAQSLKPDLDGNEINELIVTDSKFCNSTSYKEYNEPSGDTLTSFVIAFRNLLNVTGDTDVLTVYFRLVLGVSKGGTAQQFVVNPIVRITNVNTSLQTPGTIAVGGSRVNVITVFGSAIFPVKAFGQTLPEGVYDLVLTFDIPQAVSIDFNSLRLEYIAVVGANYTMYWSAN